MKKIYSLCSKNKKLLGTLFIIFGLLAFLFLEKYYVKRPFSFDRMLFYIYVVSFIGLHFFMDIKKIWNFIFEKRFIIGLVLFFYVVLMGYNGSSIYAYNDAIEPDYVTKEFAPIWGVKRAIRSDEYLVDTSSVLSQYNHNKDFSSVNNALMGRDTNVLLYPQLPTKNISILTNIRLLGFLILDIEQAYAFYWFLPYFVLFFALFELFRILTKKNNVLSLVSTCMLEFAPGLLWWGSTSFLLYGSLATIFFYHLFYSHERWKKVLFAILLGWAGSSYVMTLYPAWMIPYGYLFLMLFIYMIYLNKQKIHWTDFLYLFISICIMGGLLIPLFIQSKDTLIAMLSTEYPGSRSSVGGTHFSYFYNYFSSIFYSFVSISNPCELSQYISFYPLPILLAVFYLIKDSKKKKYNILLLLLTILAILLSIWNYIPIGIFSKISLLYMSTPERTQMVVGVICIFITIILMNDYLSQNTVSKTQKIVACLVAIVMSLVGIFIAKRTTGDYLNTIRLLISFSLFLLLFYLLVLNSKRSQLLFSGIMLFISIFQFATIHPINKGLNIMFEKPFAKEVQLLAKNNKNGLWLVVDAPLHLQSYILANGARVLNSTNYYPNLELWKKFDENGDFNYVYNRYAHIMISLTEEKQTNFELMQDDLFKVNLNVQDICQLGIDYLATTKSLEKNTLFDKIYQRSNIIVYQVHC